MCTVCSFLVVCSLSVCTFVCSLFACPFVCLSFLYIFSCCCSFGFCVLVYLFVCSFRRSVKLVHIFKGSILQLPRLSRRPSLLCISSVHTAVCIDATHSNPAAEHILTVHQQCPYCSVYCCQSQHAAEHILTVYQQCPYCSVYCCQSQHAAEHILTVYQQCPYCSVYCCQSQHAAEHILTVYQQCPYCSVYYCQSQHAAEHILTVYQQCPYCSVYCCQSQHAAEHILTVYQQCPYCSVYCCQSQHAAEHILTVHQQCPYCGVYYCQSQHAAEHILTVYQQCPYCSVYCCQTQQSCSRTHPYCISAVSILQCVLLPDTAVLQQNTSLLYISSVHTAVCIAARHSMPAAEHILTVYQQCPYCSVYCCQTQHACSRTHPYFISAVSILQCVLLPDTACLQQNTSLLYISSVHTAVCIAATHIMPAAEHILTVYQQCPYCSVHTARHSNPAAEHIFTVYQQCPYCSVHTARHSNPAAEHIFTVHHQCPYCSVYCCQTQQSCSRTHLYCTSSVSILQCVLLPDTACSRTHLYCISAVSILQCVLLVDTACLQQNTSLLYISSVHTAVCITARHSKLPVCRRKHQPLSSTPPLTAVAALSYTKASPLTDVVFPSFPLSASSYPSLNCSL